MYRPAFIPKLRLNFEKTWRQVLHFVDNPKQLAPAPAPAHLQAVLHPQQTVQLPQLRGNLVHTLKEIVRIFMAQWSKAKTAINLAIYTNRTAMAKAGRNRDPKTGYRHILALIEYGFLRGKVQVKGGLQLLLEPKLFVFDAAAPLVAATVAPAPALVAACTPAEGIAGLLNLAQHLTRASGRKLTKNGRRPS